MRDNKRKQYNATININKIKVLGSMNYSTDRDFSPGPNLGQAKKKQLFVESYRNPVEACIIIIMHSHTNHNFKINITIFL